MKTYGIPLVAWLGSVLGLVLCLLAQGMLDWLGLALVAAPLLLMAWRFTHPHPHPPSKSDQEAAKG